mgnify:CR=1 FL=1
MVGPMVGVTYIIDSGAKANVLSLVLLPIENKQKNKKKEMEHTVDGNSEMGEHVYSEIFDSICLRHLFRSSAVSIFFSLKKTVFFYIYTSLFQVTILHIFTIGASFFYAAIGYRNGVSSE